MADGVPITAGSGTTIATDDTGVTGHVQLVKLAYSADASATLITADANGLKVNASGTAVPITDNSGSLTVDAPVGTPVFVRLSDGTSAIATLPVSASQTGTWTVGINIATSTSATLANVNASATSVTLLASNANRKGMSFMNDSTATCYVKFGTTASTTSFTVRLDAYGYYELMGNGVYTGRVDAIWSSAAGAARTTEW